METIPNPFKISLKIVSNTYSTQAFGERFGSGLAG